MKIVVIGAGAIGGLVAGYLKQKGQDVSLIGRIDSVKAIREKGLQICGVRGDFNIKIEVIEKLNFNPGLVILATKTQDIDSAIKDNFKFINGAVILTTQNGVQADSITARYLPKDNIISSIVMFGSTCLEPAKILHNFEGSWMIGRAFGQNDQETKRIASVMDTIFPSPVVENLQGMKYLKIFVNANNCIPAILGKSMQEAFSYREISAISIAIWKEGLDAINKSGIKLVSLPDFPLERLNKLTSLPLTDAAGIFSGIMVNLSKIPLYGSILQSIKRNKRSEIDYINGEFVNLANESKLGAPLNKKLVEMVHEVENTHRFFSKEELIVETKAYVGQ